MAHFIALCREIVGETGGGWRPRGAYRRVGGMMEVEAAADGEGQKGCRISVGAGELGENTRARRSF